MAADFSYRNLRINQIASKYNTPPTLLATIAINLFIFVLYHLITIPARLFNIPLDSILTENLAVPAYLTKLLLKPWTLFTYMFFHQEIWHILFNLLWLWFFGRMFLKIFSRFQFKAIYVLGGLAGAALYILAYNTFPYFQATLPFAIALGASASIMALTLAVVLYIPNEKVYLYGLLGIKLKWLAFILILFDLFSVTGGNAGGHIAHLGGAMLGIAFAYSLKRGIDITAWIRPRKLITKIPKFTGKHRRTKSGNNYHGRSSQADQDYNQRKAEENDRIDRILRKLARGGYAALTNEEKELLFRQRK